MDNEQFELGKLTGEVHNLTSSMIALRNDIDNLRISLEALKIWKGQVMVISWVSSLVASGMFWTFGFLVNKLWR